MTGFEVRMSGARSNCSTKCATTTALNLTLASCIAFYKLDSLLRLSLYYPESYIVPWYILITCETSWWCKDWWTRYFSRSWRRGRRRPSRRSWWQTSWRKGGSQTPARRSKFRTETIERIVITFRFVNRWLCIKGQCYLITKSLLLSNDICSKLKAGLLHTW